jgi:two-component system, OmpR family, sensor histidine kinase KdpD
VLGRLRDLRDAVSRDEGSPRSNSAPLLALAYVGPLMVVAVATVALRPLRDLVPNDLIALAYVLVVILIADLGPTRGWWVASVSSCLVLNYFFTQPYNTFFVSSPHDVVLLALFLVVGLVSSRQVRRLRYRTRQAEQRHHDLQLVNTLSAAMVSSVTAEDMAHALCEALGAVGIGKVVLFETDSERAGRMLRAHGDVPEPAEVRAAEWVARENKAIGIPRTPADSRAAEPWPVCASSVDFDVPPGAFVPLLSSKRLEGVLFAAPATDRPAPFEAESRLIVSASNLAGTFLERRELQRQANAVVLLRESERLKSNLYSAVSHDIKTPLAAAKAYVSHLLIGDVSVDDERQTEDLQATAEALDRLGGMIDDLIDLSLLESEGWRQKIELCEPGELLSAVLARLAPQPNRVLVDLADAPYEIRVDFRQMERAVRNLVGNALAYSQGEVRVGVSLEPRGVAIAVEDEGPGVSVDERDVVFDKFYRGASSSDAPGGSGLGLSIVREVARAHGGFVTVEGVRPTGARFSIILPRSVACLQDAPPFTGTGGTG